jgi:cobalt-zinc-cadmium efflux system membrane fusion protein
MTSGSRCEDGRSPVGLGVLYRVLVAACLCAPGAADRALAGAPDPATEGAQRMLPTPVPPAPEGPGLLPTIASDVAEHAARVYGALTWPVREAHRELAYFLGWTSPAGTAPRAYTSVAQRAAEIAATTGPPAAAPAAPPPSAQTTTAPGGVQQVDAGASRPDATAAASLPLATASIEQAKATPGVERAFRSRSALPGETLPLETPQRQADGSYFVPKSLQRLYDIRTRTVAVEPIAATVKIPGRIVPDPNTRGNVQSSVTGRIEPPPNGLPVVGSVVAKGDVVAYVAPALSVVDRSALRREITRLNNEINVAEERLERLKSFTFVPFREGKIRTGELEVEGLKKQLAAILPSLAEREVLRASASGVISASNAVAGKLVDPSQVLFEIIDPSHLWVEAQASEAELALLRDGFRDATAVTSDGITLTLSFQGSGLRLDQQFAALLFRIDRPVPGLRVGRPAMVILAGGSTIDGMRLPRESVVRLAGVDTVFEHSAPEVFTPRAVRIEPTDANTVTVLSGVRPGARVVATGARLLSQLQ